MAKTKLLVRYAVFPFILRKPKNKIELGFYKERKGKR